MKEYLSSFLLHPVIRKISAKPYWTINISKSIVTEDNADTEEPVRQGKKPLDFKSFAETGIGFGARDESCLVPMNDILKLFMKWNRVPQQLVYHLDAARDGFVVLDIEPCCPDNIKQQLLQMPYLYGEVSMSGKGYHLVFPAPEFNDVTRNKIVLKDPSNTYEVLICHYVSFTGRMIAPCQTPKYSFTALWNALAQHAAETSYRVIDVTKDRPDTSDIPNYDKLYSAVMQSFDSRFWKTQSDYGDWSKYEFAVIGAVRAALLRMLDMPVYADIELTENQKIWLVFDIITEVLEHRPKHDETRDGKPFLLWRTEKNFALTTEEKDKEYEVPDTVNMHQTASD